MSSASSWIRPAISASVKSTLTRSCSACAESMARTLATARRALVTRGRSTREYDGSRPARTPASARLVGRFDHEYAVPAQRVQAPGEVDPALSVPVADQRLHGDDVLVE